MLELVLAQLKRYPGAELQDIIKALYQAQFGNGHFVPADGSGLKRLLDELAACSPDADVLIEPLGDQFARVHLGALAQHGLSPGTLYQLFELSAAQASGSMEAFLLQLDHLEALVSGGLLPINLSNARESLVTYRREGCPPLHHSQAFRARYAPAYRVIRAEYIKWLPVFISLDNLLAVKDRVLFAIEGGSASGKTSLAALLQQVYACNVIHMDDFFLQAHQRTPERYQTPGGNVDVERFSREVLSPLLQGQAFSFRPFNCQTMGFDPAVRVNPRPLTIIEGAYSLHPALEQAYDCSVFLDVDPHTQAERILKRNGPHMHQRFLMEWIPLEEIYFDKTGARERADLLIPVTDEA